MHPMIEMLFSTLKLSAFAAVGVVFGAITEHSIPITEHTNIPIGMAAGVLVAGILSAMWLSRNLQRLSDKLEALEKNTNRLEGLILTVNQLPCRGKNLLPSLDCESKPSTKEN